MKIVKLIDRINNEQVTPMTHKDSVMNSDGKILDELYAPLEHVGATGNITVPDGAGGFKVIPQHPNATQSADGFMSKDDKKKLDTATLNDFTKINVDTESGVRTEMPASGHDQMTFKSGRHITVTANPSTGNDKIITFTHDVLNPAEKTAELSQLVPEQIINVTSVVLDSEKMGHITDKTVQPYKLPVKIRVNPSGAGSVHRLVGTPNDAENNQLVYQDSELVYTSKSDKGPGVLDAPTINSNFAGGAKGDIPYQTAANTTTMLTIGTETQVLRSVKGVPTWTGDNGIKSWAWTNGTTSGPTATATRVDNTTVAIPAVPSASNTQSGIVTTEAQTIKGAKTFSDGITGHITDLTGGKPGSLPYQATGNDTAMLDIGAAKQVLRSVGGLPKWSNDTGLETDVALKKSVYVNGTSNGPILKQTLVDGEVYENAPIPAATNSNSGVVSTVAQTFKGEKTFEDNVVMNGSLTVNGDIFAKQQHDLFIEDKIITLAYSDSATIESGNKSGIEVTTHYDPLGKTGKEQYQGPNILWDMTNGWTTGNTDTTQSIVKDFNLGDANSAYRINGAKVLTASQYTGNAATASKTNHKITFHDKSTFDGSLDKAVNYDTVGAAQKNHASTTIDYGVGSNTNYGHIKVKTEGGITVDNGVISATYSDVAGKPLASAAAIGTSFRVARADHVHPFPNINDCTNTLNVNKGGTGKTTLPTNGILYGQGTSAVAVTPAGTNEQVLMANSTGVPVFTTLKLNHISDAKAVPLLLDTGHVCDDFAPNVPLERKPAV